MKIFVLILELIVAIFCCYIMYLDIKQTINCIKKIKESRGK